MSSPSPRARSRTTILNVSLAIVGGLLLYITVRRVGWHEVQASIVRIGWWFAAILILGGLRFAARAAAWMVCAEPHAVPGGADSRPAHLGFARAFSATLAGDALGNVTPFGLLASEPAKVLLVKNGLSTVTAVASVAAENAFYIVSVLAVIAAGALVFFGIANVPPALAAGVQIVLGGVVAAGLAAIWIARLRPAVLTRVARAVAKATGRESGSADRLREIEIHFYALLTWPAERVARVFAWEALFHIGAVAEVFLVLKLLPGGAQTTLLEAFVLETTGRLIVVVFKFVPYRLGVDEAGTALVARALTLDPAVGVTLALVRRMRILVWNAIGLLILAVRRSG